MLSATTRVIVYDSSSLQSELLATGLESLELGFEIKCANNLEFLIDLLTMDSSWVVVISDTSMNGSAISLAKHLRAQDWKTLSIPRGKSKDLNAIAQTSERGLLRGPSGNR